MRIRQLKITLALLSLSLLLSCTSPKVINNPTLVTPPTALLTLPSEYNPEPFKTTGDILEQRDGYKQERDLLRSQLAELIQWFKDLGERYGK